MQPYQPFQGVLLMPGRAPFGTVSPVTLPDGLPVAHIRWHNWSMRARFEILDGAGAVELAHGGRQGMRRYQVLGPREEPLLHLKLGLFSAARRTTVTLPDGRVLSANGNWSGRRFAITDQSGLPVARIATTSGVFALRADSFAFELVAPVLSIVQAVGLAQCMRAAVESARRVASS
ncbi:hypothetical protein GCM10023322_36130 [Rugosimonospora acidiphila]|uniref:Scramblase n=1 Tax=Rugosimonospora acidiphila TaxID=556531 RepID=A0ABP9RUQ7_9ACTN